jgi:hypothetical protein
VTQSGAPQWPFLRLVASLVLPIAGELALAQLGLLDAAGLAFVLAAVTSSLLAVVPLLGTSRGGRDQGRRAFLAVALGLVSWGVAVVTQRVGGGPVDPALTGVLGGYLVAWAV